MWLARDKDNKLHIFFKHPFKKEELGFWVDDPVTEPVFIDEQDCNEFLNIKWEDKEPTQLF